MDSNTQDTPPSAPPNGTGPRPPSGTRMWIDFGPLVVFLVTNFIFKDAFIATGALMAAVLIAVIASLKIEHRIPPMTLFTAIAVGIFGGLTIWMQDEEFIKIKLTIINVLFGVVLLGGVAMGHSLLKSLLGQSLALSDEAWRSLTVRYALFFLATAGINEIVRRQVDWDTYVNFKVFGVLGLTVIFSLTQAPFLNRHIQRSGGGGTGSGSSPQI